MNKNLKLILMILFFPITLTYLIWKQTWSGKAKVLATIALWALFIGVGSSGNAGNTGSQAITPSPTPVKQEEQKPTYTLEQKQEDFKKYYVDYTKRGAVLLFTKSTIVKMASSTGSKAELYLALDKVSTALDNAGSFDNVLPIPDSLKEYKDMSTANMYLQLTATAYHSAVEKFMVYLNKDDLKALKDAQSNSERGDQNLLTSSESVQKVAKELQIDTSQIKAE